MTAATLGCFIAGIFVAAFVVLWFYISFRELSAKRRSLEAISEQLQLHSRLYMQERGGNNDTAAQKILANKLMVYSEVRREYNALLKKPLYCIPGYFMGFHKCQKEGEL